MHVQEPNLGTCLKRALFPSLEPRGLSGTIWWGPIFGRGAAWSPKLRLCSNRWVLSAPGSSNPYIFAQQLSQWQAITRGQNQAWVSLRSDFYLSSLWEQNFLHTFLLFHQIQCLTFWGAGNLALRHIIFSEEKVKFNIEPLPIEIFEKEKSRCSLHHSLLLLSDWLICWQKSESGSFERKNLMVTRILRALCYDAELTFFKPHKPQNTFTHHI